jgi:phage terminase large subunit GpA-like protein
MSISYKSYKAKEKKRKEKNRLNALKGKKSASKKQSAKIKKLPSWRDKYIAYIKSPQWKEKRLRALKTWGNVCQMCGSSNRIEVHHKTYDRLGKELMTDLMIVCHSCHEKIHERSF